jgi:hypothetical protein
MDDEFINYEIVSVGTIGYATWSLGIFAGLLSFVTVYGGPRVGYSDGNYPILWFHSINYLMFACITIVWALSIAVYFRKLGQTRNKAASYLTALVSIMTVIFWGGSFFSYMGIGYLSYAETEARFLLVQTLFGLGGITLGLSLFLAGILYAIRPEGSRALSILTGIIFIMTGMYGLTIGIASGDSSVPMVTIYDIPWIPVAAIVASIMGIVINAKSPKIEHFSVMTQLLDQGELES